MAVPEWMEMSYPQLILCEAKAERSARRHLERGLKDPTRELFHGDQRVKTYRETGEFLQPGDYDAPKFDCPTLTVNTADGYDPQLEEIVTSLDLPLGKGALDNGGK